MISWQETTRVGRLPADDECSRRYPINFRTDQGSIYVFHADRKKPGPIGVPRGRIKYCFVGEVARTLFVTACTFLVQFPWEPSLSSLFRSLGNTPP